MRVQVTLARFSLVLVSALALFGLATVSLRADREDYQALKAEAERLYAEGSYARAHEIYTRARDLGLSGEELHWARFRVADTLWRSQAATTTADSTRFDQARSQLEALLGELKAPGGEGQIWAQVQQSLGDFWWSRRNVRSWGAAWTHYQQALDWWAGAQEIGLAGRRYLGLIWSMARPPEADPYYYYGYYGNVIPLEILENGLKIAQADNDKAHLHYLIAMTIRQQGGYWEQRLRVVEEFEAALKPGRSTDWYDDAVYYYGYWLASQGRSVQQEDGRWTQEPDYVAALGLFRRILSEYNKGESRYYDDAKQQIETITKPVVGVNVSNIFLPDSEIQIHLNWRNVGKVDLSIYKVDLNRQVRFIDKDKGAGSWVQQIDLAHSPTIKSWTVQVKDIRDYKPGQDMIRLDSKLPIGAYVVEVRGGGVSARDLILVSDVSLVLKRSPKQALAYFCNSIDGSPVRGGQLKWWARSYVDNRWVWNEYTTQTDQSGLSVFELPGPGNNIELFVGAQTGERQCFAVSPGHGYGASQEPWRIYAFTDRPAYRPNEEVRWKIVARKYSGSVYVTPSDQTLHIEISDPRGSKVREDRVKLNAFGSGWGSLELTESMPLGEYKVNFWEDRGHHHVGSATLFRLEEYKLPEFRVDVRMPEEDGKKKAFRVGDTVQVDVQADYYFGGPVANATVEVLVHQNPFSHGWQPTREFPWFYDDLSPQRYSYGGRQGQIIKRETLKTDVTGRASLHFQTPRGSPQDFEYYVETRVTDASRREIIGSGTVRVTRQRFYVYARSRHNIYRPQDKASVDIKAMDANDQPVEVEGTVRVTRDFWFEIWLDPTGREVKGDELRSWRERSKVFPPPQTVAGGRPWRLKFQGYQHDDILKRTLKTGARGEAEFTFVPEREGYYRIVWSTQEKGSIPIRAETTIWVATHAATDLGYRYGGLEIIVDQDTFRVGQKTPVMLVSPSSDRYALFSVEGEELYSYQLVHFTGTVKLIEVAVEERHVPNIFLDAAMVSDGQVLTDTKQVVVPPIDHFLKVEVKSDREQYQPREEGSMTITTRDQNDRPVAAEVAIGLVDESVYYVQQDYAGDPRQFFYGGKRGRFVQMQSTFQQKSYAKLVEGEDRKLVDERELLLDRDRNSRGDYVAGSSGPRMALTIGGGVGYASGAGNEISKTTSDAVFAQKAGQVSAEAAAADGFRQAGSEPVVQVRSDFRSTVFWQPAVATDGSGQATVRVKFPDSLTAWKATARVVAEGNQFGVATSSARTQQPLIVRLQALRFFVVGDSVTISAVIINNTDEPMNVTSSLSAEGIEIDGFLEEGELSSKPSSFTTVPAGGEIRIDWRARVQHPGEARLKVVARAPEHADAMEQSYPVYEHGIEKFVAKSGKLRDDDITVRLDIPEARKRESTTLTLQVTPSMAAMMLDALPYLIDYPYGCTEQTMSRFIPAAIVAKALKDLGLRPEIVMKKVLEGIDGEPLDRTRPAQPKDLRQLDAMVNQGLRRLYDFQHPDGGWGWWKEGESDHFMSAYVVWGFVLARGAGMEIRPDVLERGASFLEKEIVEEEAQHDRQAWMLHALSAYHASQKSSSVGRFESTAFENLWASRDRLNAYTRALLTLSAHHFGYDEKARTLMRNLENGVKMDDSPDTSILIGAGKRSHQAVMATAHWGEDGIYWRWSDGGVEATAFCLRALLAVDPKNKLIEPVTNWLIKNRQGSRWSNTRDTAITTLALTDYLRASDELKSEIQYEVHVNGHPTISKKLTAEEALGAPSQFVIGHELILDGVNEIRIVRKAGTGPIYFAAQAKFFSLEEPITAAGNEIFVRRQYFRLVGHPTLLKGYVYERERLKDGDSVTSGDRIETVITIEAKNNYEYLVFEDLKPAGFEAVRIRSGESLFAKQLRADAVERRESGVARFESQDVETADEKDYTGAVRWVYQELRDRKVALFIDHLPEGIWEVRYDMRAEVPGEFHALPVIGHAMYVPQIRANGAEMRITVADKK